MQEICEDIKANAREILGEWDQFTKEQPWASLPKDYRIDHLPEVIVGLAEASSLCDSRNVDSHRENVWVAANHGTDRREQGFADHLIFQEHQQLRQVIWHYLHRKNYKDALQAINRIDTAITLSTMASIRGFYRSEFEARGEWP